MNNPDLDRLFNPESFAMIGASSKPGKWGSIILINILKANFLGKVYPINPTVKSILGIKCYPKVADVPGPIDVAMITTPAKTVSALIDECGKKGIPNVIVVTSDFSESGPEGTRMEKEIVEKAQSYGIHIVGPNTMGIFSAKTNLHALMPMVMPQYGGISMFSQSGNVGVQMLDYGVKENVGFDKFVSSGNEGDLNCVDYLKYFAQDDDTKVIMGYVEGVDAATDFLPVARKISREKPIIIMKGGRTNVGTKAAASHSGSMAGSARINRAAFQQAGIVSTNTSLELIDTVKAFANYPLPKGKRVGIVTRGGGWGVLAADACEEAGLEVPALSDELIKEMNKLLPDYWSRDNPVDLVASIAGDPMPTCLSLLAEWEGIDAIIALGAGFRSYAYNYSEEVKGPKELLEIITFLSEYFKEGTKKPDQNLELIGKLVKTTGKPIISVSIGSEYSQRQFFEDYEIISFPTPERAVRVLKHMCDYRRFLNSPAE